MERRLLQVVLVFIVLLVVTARISNAQDTNATSKAIDGDDDVAVSETSSNPFAELYSGIVNWFSNQDMPSGISWLFGALPGNYSALFNDVDIQYLVDAWQLMSSQEFWTGVSRFLDALPGNFSALSFDEQVQYGKEALASSEINITAVEPLLNYTRYAIEAFAKRLFNHDAWSGMSSFFQALPENFTDLPLTEQFRYGMEAYASSGMNFTAMELLPNSTQYAIEAFMTRLTSYNIWSGIPRFFIALPGNFSALTLEEQIKYGMEAYASSGMNFSVMEPLLNSTRYVVDAFEKRFSGSTVWSLIPLLSNVLQGNFSALSITEMVQFGMEAFNASGVDLSSIEPFLNAMELSQLDLPEIFNKVGQDGLPSALGLVTQVAESQISAVLLQSGVSSLCQQQMTMTVQGMGNSLPWALQMVDAMGKPGSGILTGNLQWLGSFDQCVQVKAVTYGNYTTQENPVHHFSGQYCSIEYSPGKLGLCVPDGCSKHDIDSIIAAVASPFTGGADLSQSVKVNCQLNSLSLDTGSIIVLCVLAILGFLMVAATLYDVLVVQGRTDDTKDNPSLTSKPIDNGVTNPVYITEEDSIPVKFNSLRGDPNWTALPGQKFDQDIEEGEDTVTPEDSVSVSSVAKGNGHNVADRKPTPPAKAPRSNIEGVVLAFSMYTNAVKLMGTRQAEGSLGSIHGIRFLSMAWVILGHTYFFAYVGGNAENIFVHFLEKLYQWTFMSVAYASFSVDSFFALSGLLVAYLSLREMKKVGGVLKFKWGMYYFHRFWRLTPPYMLMIMVYVTMFRYVSDGPMWEQSEDSLDLPYCRRNWWTNLLYINNFVKPMEACVGWSWYLSNDMQFYVLSPLLMIPLFYNAIAGGVVCLVFLIATTVTPALIAKEHEYPAQQYGLEGPQPKDADYFSNLYIKPYARMGPYIIGMVTGYILYRTKCKCRIPKLVNMACWLLTAGIMTSCIYGLYSKDGNHVLNVEESAFYIAVSRTGWSVAVCWVIFACATGYGGVVNELLSWKAFIPLGRLTYCAYLIHPIVMMAYYQSRRRLVYFTDYEATYLFLAHLVVSYGAAFCMSLAFESPMMGLEKVVFRRDKRS